jgi:HD-like signal output (HDOD) protein
MRDVVSSLLSTPVHYREKALRGLSQLPPFSPILNKLLATLAKEDVSFSQLADLIEKDAVLAANVLRLVNSALYGLRGTVNSVRHAVSIMGLDKLRNTAISLSVARIWNQVDTPAEWSQAQFNAHAVAVAILSDLLVQRVEAEYPEGAFAAGLLHDLGILLVAVTLRDEFDAIRRRCQSVGRPLVDCEREQMGVDHAALSADALSQWNLPAAIQQAVRLHHAPERTSAGGWSLSNILGAADRIANLHGIPAQKWIPPVAGTPHSVLQEFGLDEDAARMLAEFDQEFGAIRTFFA